MLTEEEHALVILMEECSEVQKAVAKALRFGLTHFWEKEGTTNLEAIVLELRDVKFMVNRLIDIKALPDNVLTIADSFVKEDKFFKTLAMSRRLGRVIS